MAPFTAGIVLNIVADRAFKQRKTTVKPFQESASLVTSGVYRLSRHPMYLGFVLILLSMAIFAGSLTPMLVTLIGRAQLSDEDREAIRRLIDGIEQPESSS